MRCWYVEYDAKASLWQMWFAALGSYQHNPWLLHMLYKLLLGSPEVTICTPPE